MYVIEQGDEHLEQLVLVHRAPAELEVDGDVLEKGTRVTISIDPATLIVRVPRSATGRHP